MEWGDFSGAVWEAIPDRPVCSGQEALAARIRRAESAMPPDVLFWFRSRCVGLSGRDTLARSSAEDLAYHVLGGDDCAVSSENGRQLRTFVLEQLGEWDPGSTGAAVVDAVQGAGVSGLVGAAVVVALGLAIWKAGGIA